MARRVATSEWIMTLSCVCRHAARGISTPANIQIHRDSGNCLIGLGALLRRIKQSQGMSRSWGRQHSTAAQGQTNHCQSLKPRPLRLVFPHSSRLLEFCQTAAHFVGCTFFQECHHDSGWIGPGCQIGPTFTQLCRLPRRHWTSHFKICWHIRLNLTWFRNVSLHLHPLVGGDSLLGFGGVVPVV